MRIKYPMNLPGFFRGLSSVVLILGFAVTACGRSEASEGDSENAENAPLDFSSGEEPSEDDGETSSEANLPVSQNLPEIADGALIGRIVDRETGLPIGDAGVVLLELGQRAITRPDGQFRFDGVPPGSHTLVIGPADGYISRSLNFVRLQEGLNIGLIALQPAAPSVLIMPDYGGQISACGQTLVQLPSDSVPSPSEVRFSCVDSAASLPAPPPAGRLPLAVVDLAPEQLNLAAAGHLRIALPSQPHYSEGVELDLLRLDYRRLIWLPSEVFKVSKGGRVANGTVHSFGTYMLAAPPFGTFLQSVAENAALTRINTSDLPQGQPVSNFEPGRSAVYVEFDYANLKPETTVQLKTADHVGNLIWENELALGGDGHHSLAMKPDGEVWSEGDYVTSIYFGDPPEIRSIEWRVSMPTPTPAAPFVNVAGASQANAAATVAAFDGAIPGPALGSSAPFGCKPPTGWWTYWVKPGDTLYSLAQATGISVIELQKANCLNSYQLHANTAIHLPTIPGTWRPPNHPSGSPKKTAMPGPGSGGNAPPSSGRPTPGADQPNWNPNKGLRGPDPTLAPRPDRPAVPPTAIPRLPGDAGSAGARDIGSPNRPPSGGGSGGSGASAPQPKDTRPPDPTLAPRPTAP